MTESPWERTIYDVAAAEGFLYRDMAEQWLDARREAMDHLVGAIALSSWADNLVLRGSVLLKAWFGALAREPGDLDFVVRPEDRRIDSDSVDDMFEEISDRAEALSRSGGTVRLAAHRSDYEVERRIWTYSGTPGRRLELSWECPYRGYGALHLDFAFGEPLLDAPVRVDIPRFGSPGPPVPLHAASRSLSLAWKLLWLGEEYDVTPGKDLYDAVLLAEHCAPVELPDTLLYRLFATADSERYWHGGLGGPNDIRSRAAAVDWRSFVVHYPLLEDAHEEFTDRLTRAMSPIFPAAS